MSFLTAERVARIKPSPTLAVAAKADLLKAQGRDIINLGVGEPDFDTQNLLNKLPSRPFSRVYQIYRRRRTLSLRQAVVAKFARDNQLFYTPEQILVSCGAKQSCYNLMQALLNDDDEVIIPAPYWVSYPDMALLAGAKPVIVSTTIEQKL